jgi:AcrR family transcriptional regulator
MPDHAGRTDARPAFPPSNGGYAKGQETREAILTAALRVLVDEGYAAMTMRCVAKECGIRFGNLTYHYRSHEDLVNALFEAVIGAYEAEFALIVNARTPRPPTACAGIAARPDRYPDPRNDAHLSRSGRLPTTARSLPG